MDFLKQVFITTHQTKQNKSFPKAVECGYFKNIFNLYIISYENPVTYLCDRTMAKWSVYKFVCKTVTSAYNSSNFTFRCKSQKCQTSNFYIFKIDIKRLLPEVKNLYYRIYTNGDYFWKHIGRSLMLLIKSSNKVQTFHNIYLPIWSFLFRYQPKVESKQTFEEDHPSHELQKLQFFFREDKHKQPYRPQPMTWRIWEEDYNFIGPKN